MAVLVVALAIFAPSAGAAVFFHAALLRSTPSADAKLSKAPKDIRLVFSEEVVPSLSQVTLIGPTGDSTKLRVTNDPHDVHTLVGAVSPALASGGRYSVFWRVVSADGHLVDGTFSFSLAGPVATAPTAVLPPPIGSQKQPPASPTVMNAEVPAFAALLRGLGLGALMAAVGILFFGATTQQGDARVPQSLVLWLTAAGALLLSAHLVAWLIHLGTTSQDETFFVVSVFRTKLGRVELVRTALALLTLIAVLTGRSNRVPLVFGLLCLAVSGAVGHSAAINPALAIPGKSIHLIASALWLGGLLWLLATSGADVETRRSESFRVSAYALIAVIAVVLSGLLQTVLALNTPADLLSSTYGKLVIAKIIGLLILIVYGAYNRYSVLPEYAAGGEVKLRRSMKQEIMIMSFLILIGGFLAYTSPPPPGSSAPVTRGTE